MKKVFYILVLVFALSACGNIENKVNIQNTTGNKQMFGSDKIDENFKKYLEVVQSLNISGCSIFTGDYNQRCKLDILSTLGKLKNEKDCNIFDGDILKECMKVVYKTTFQCKKLSLLEEQKACLENKYYKKALEEKNIYLCNYIIDLKNREYCKDDVKNILEQENIVNKKGNGSTNIIFKECDTDNINCKIQKMFVSFNSNPSLKEKKQICDKINKLNNIEGKRCYDNYYSIKALNYLDYKICGNISDKKIKYNCEQGSLYQQAIENIDASKCNLLNEKKEQCLDEVLLRKITRDSLKESELCEKMHSVTYKNLCLEAIKKNF